MRRTPLRRGKAPLRRSTGLSRDLERKQPVRNPSYPRTLRGAQKVCQREGCEKEFYVRPSDLGRKFCSRECDVDVRRGVKRPELAAKTAGSRKGRANPNFRHGKRVGEREISKVFNLRLKGETKCRCCPKPAHDLHHAIPRSLGTPESKRNLLNGLPLCKPCHSRWHRRTLTIYRDVFTPEEWAYLLAVPMTGRVTEAWLDDRYPARPEVAAA